MPRGNPSPKLAIIGLNTKLVWNLALFDWFLRPPLPQQIFELHARVGFAVAVFHDHRGI
jgi:hypothetical protein